MPGPTEDVMPGKILVVDDSKLVTDIVKLRLEMFGFQVRLAHSGEAANPSTDLIN